MIQIRSAASNTLKGIERRVRAGVILARNAPYCSSHAAVPGAIVCYTTHEAIYSILEATLSSHGMSTFSAVSLPFSVENPAYTSSTACILPFRTSFMLLDMAYEKPNNPAYPLHEAFFPPRIDPSSLFKRFYRILTLYKLSFRQSDM